MNIKNEVYFQVNISSLYSTLIAKTLLFWIIVFLCFLHIPSHSCPYYDGEVQLSVEIYFFYFKVIKAARKRNPLKLCFKNKNSFYVKCCDGRKQCKCCGTSFEGQSLRDFVAFIFKLPLKLQNYIAFDSSSFSADLDIT